jgi:hypothetical protein
MTETIPRKRGKGKRRRIRFLPFFFVILLLAVSVYTASVLRRVLPSIVQRSEELSILRVEVLNGCGVPKLARAVSWELRRLGFDVVNVGDARQTDFDETVVIERRDKTLRNAKRVAQKIGCKKIVEDVDSTRYLEATLILGMDYQKYFPQLKFEPE